MALVFFHRGKTLRPELDDFRLGIQKASEAIDNAVGSMIYILLTDIDPRKCKFTPPTGIKLIVSTPPAKSNRMIDGKITSGQADITEWVCPKAPTQPTYGRKLNTKDSEKSEKRSKQLLGELYADRDYLIKLRQDKGILNIYSYIQDFSNNPNANISSLVQDALKYLDTRTEFWRQQKPAVYVSASKKRLVQEINSRNQQLIEQKAKDSKVRIQNKDRAKPASSVPLRNAQTAKSAKFRKPLDAPVVKRDLKT